MSKKLTGVEVLWGILGMHTKKGMCGRNNYNCFGEHCDFSVKDWETCEWRSPVGYWVKEKLKQKNSGFTTKGDEVGN